MQSATSGCAGQRGQPRKLRRLAGGGLGLGEGRGSQVGRLWRDRSASACPARLRRRPAGCATPTASGSTTSRFRRISSGSLGRPVRLENDANCFALSEALGGAADGASGGVRGDSRHRLWRRRGGRRADRRGAQPDRRRMGAHAPSLADSRGARRSSLLVRPNQLPGDLDFRHRASAPTTSGPRANASTAMTS